MISKVSTKNMSREEWLEVRKKSIGGSDAAALLGFSSFASPYSLWAEKTGAYNPPEEETESQRVGHDLEDYVAKRFCEATGKTVRRENNIIYNSEYPFAHANVDRLVNGEDAGLECKTTQTLNLKRYRNGEFPERYYAQCVHYLMVTGKQRWYLAVLVMGKGFFHFCIERDEEEINALATAERRFWDCVVNNTPPAIDGEEPTSEVIKTIYSEDNGEEIALIGLDDALDRIGEIDEFIKELEKERESLTNTVKDALGENTYGSSTKYKVSWKAQTRRTFDVKAFQRERPDIALDRFYKFSTSRVFKIKTNE